jgi:hypothetical protein
MKRKHITILASIFLVFLFSTCKQEVGPIDAASKTFFKHMGSSSSEANTYVGKTSNGFLMAGLALTNDRLFISHCNDLGQLEWEKDIPIDRTTIFPQGVKLSDGSFIINDFNNPILTKINENGEVAYSKWISPALTFSGYIYSPVYQSNNGMCYVTYTAGSGSGSFDFNYLTEIDPDNGNATQTIRYYDKNFDGKIVRFNIMKVQDTTFWVTGCVLTGKPYSWSDPFKLFTAKIDYYNVFNLKVYEKGNNTVEMDLASVATKDNNIVLVTSSEGLVYAEKHINGPSTFKLRKIDLELNDLWEKTIDLGVNSIYPTSIEETENDELIISGSCSNLNEAKMSGFVARLDSKGNIIASKIFNLGQQHYILDSKYLPDHSYFFTGQIDNFGKGIEQEAKFYLKTDSDFNY